MVQLAEPVVSDTVQSVFPVLVSIKLTVPVGVPVPYEVTALVNVTLWPAVALDGPDMVVEVAEGTDTDC